MIKCSLLEIIQQPRIFDFCSYPTIYIYSNRNNLTKNEQNKN